MTADLGRLVGRVQSDQSSQAAVDEVFSQWQSIEDNADQINAFTQELAPYPAAIKRFLSKLYCGDRWRCHDILLTQSIKAAMAFCRTLSCKRLSENTTDGAARMFADYLLQHYSAFDASDGVAEDGIKKDGLMSSEEGFFNPADGSYTRLTEEGVFETTYQDGVVLLVRENGAAAVSDNFAASVYIIPGEPEVRVENYGGLYGEVTANGVSTPFYGLSRAHDRRRRYHSRWRRHDDI